MPFIWDATTRTAVDDDNGISIHGSRSYREPQLWGKDHAYAFQYESPPLSFWFYATFRDEKRPWLKHGQPAESLFNVGAEIVEPWLKASLRDAKGAPTSLEEYEKLKEVLKAGMAVCCAPRYLDGSSILTHDVEITFVTQPK